MENKKSVCEIGPISVKLGEKKVMLAHACIGLSHFTHDFQLLRTEDQTQCIPCCIQFTLSIAVPLNSENSSPPLPILSLLEGDLAWWCLNPLDHSSTACNHIIHMHFYIWHTPVISEYLFHKIYCRTSLSYIAGIISNEWCIGTEIKPQWLKNLE